jgi:hypothetical protein
MEREVPKLLVKSKRPQKEEIVQCFEVQFEFENYKNDAGRGVEISAELEIPEIEAIW